MEFVMGEKTVVLDAAKRYTVCEFEDRAISEGKNQDLLREVKKNSSDSTYADFEQYPILEKTGLMVSFYDIIDWFNKEYLKIKEEAKTLPKIELEVDKWELGKKEKVLFNFLRCSIVKQSPFSSPIKVENTCLKDSSVRLISEEKKSMNSSKNAAPTILPPLTATRPE